MGVQIKSTIVRSWKTTITYIIAAVIAAAVSAVLFKTVAGSAAMIIIACVLALISLLLLRLAMVGAGQCNCPGCGKQLHGLKTGSNDGTLCNGCFRYFEGKEGQLWATDESRVADSPIFTSPLPEQIAFPDICCVCGSPPTHRQTISTESGKSSGLMKSVSIDNVTISSAPTRARTAEVPHCAGHKDGVSLSGAAEHVHIRFRSYPYLRAFCEMNNIKPG